MKITPGRLSDVMAQPGRYNWFEINSRVKALQPGDSVSVEVPALIPVRKLRSAILTNARRFDYGPWRVSTRTSGRTIRCFLVPIE